jgi:hypothetical protein
MARKREVESETTDEEETPEPEKKSSSRLPLWLEEAWEGWLKSVGVILLCVIAYGVYKFDLVGESLAGLAAAAAVVLGAVGATVPLAWSRVQNKAPIAKALMAVMVIAWVVGAGYPSVRAAIPPAPIAEARLTADKLSQKVTVPPARSYEVTASGRFKQAGAGDAEASYTLKAEGGGGSDEVSGLLKRALMRVRTSRRGGTSTTVTEHTEQTHRIPHVRGPEITLSAEGIDEQLEDGLHLSLRPGGPEPLIFIVLAALAVALALGFDARLVDGRSKEKTYLAAAAGVSLVFSIAFPQDATPHSLVRPAVGALVLGALTGGLGGWLLGMLGRLMFGPKVAKKRRA